MMHRTIRFGLVAVLAASLGGVAAAQPDDPCGGGDEMGDPCGGDEGGGGDEMGGGEMGGDEGGGDVGGGDAAPAEAGEGGGHAHGLTVPKGKIAIWADIGVNLSKDAVAKPISLSPDIWYGVSDDLAVGLVHSSMGMTGFWGSAGTSLCLTGEENGCGDLYSNFGVHAEYQFQRGDLQLSGIGGINAMSLDPFTLGLQAGVHGRWQSGKVGVDFVPQIRLGLTEREIDVLGVKVPLNKETLWLPVTVMYAVDAKIHAGVQTGISGPLDGFGDAYRIPLSIGGMYMVDHKLAVGAGFTFPNIAGKGSSADGRTLDIVVGYTM